jgi:4'-phosphopantetheinyl transferase
VTVVVRCADTSRLGGGAAARLLRGLSADEVRAAQAFAFDDDRHTHVAAHALLRRALREMLDGEEPRLVREPLGRPELDPAQRGRPPLSFNLTHTRGFAACAIRRGGPVGIDAEDVRRPIDIDPVAARWFAPAERRLLANLPEAARVDAFFRIWTAKEAILKAAGLGLRLSPERFAVEPGAGHAAIPEALGIATCWRLAELAPLPHIRLTVAVPGSGPLAPSLTVVELR